MSFCRVPRAFCASLFAVLALLLGRSASAQEVPLQFLGEFDIPNGAIEFEGTPVGGLSGLAFDARRNVYYAICDDRGDLAPGRFYTLRINLGLDGIRDVQVVGVTFLDSDAGEPGVQPYERNALDSEDIVLLPDDTLLISSERDQTNRPWLRRFALDGTLLDDLPMPDLFMPQSTTDASGRMVQTRGVRSNLGFEGVTYVADESALYTLNEEALAQDGPIATVGAGTNVRLTRIGLSGGSASFGRQVVYPVERIYAAPVPPDQFADNGVSALLSIRHLLPGFDFLLLERAFVTGVGNDVNVYGVRVGSAQDVSGLAALPSPFTGATATKTLVTNMASLGITADNLETLALGPRLADGRASLLIMSDDNFSETQVNQFLLFALGAPSGK
jgi:3-phytase